MADGKIGSGKMKLGIVGTNFIHDSIAEAAKHAADVTVSAVYSRKADTGNAFASRHGIENVFSDYTEMLDSGVIDAVYIGSPTCLHLEMSRLAMERKIPVLCEKMITATEREFVALCENREKYGGVIIEAMRPDFDERLLFLKNNLSLLGKIKSCELDFRQYSRRYDAYKRGERTNAFDPAMKNSALSDIGIYPLHLSVSLFGLPRDVRAEGTFLNNGFLAEGKLELDYGDFVSTVLYSKIYESENVSRICGELGEVSFDKMNEPKTLDFRLCNGKTLSAPSFCRTNLVDELNAFRQVALGDVDLETRLFSVTEQTMSLVGRIHRELGIDFE